MYYQKFVKSYLIFQVYLCILQGIKHSYCYLFLAIFPLILVFYGLFITFISCKNISWIVLASLCLALKYFCLYFNIKSYEWGFTLKLTGTTNILATCPPSPSYDYKRVLIDRKGIINAFNVNKMESCQNF